MFLLRSIEMQEHGRLSMNIDEHRSGSMRDESWGPKDDPTKFKYRLNKNNEQKLEHIEK